MFPESRLPSLLFFRTTAQENASIIHTTCPYCFKTIASSADLWILDCADRAHSCPRLERARFEQAEASDPASTRMFRAQIPSSLYIR